MKMNQFKREVQSSCTDFFLYIYNRLYAQLNYFLINAGVPDLSSHGNNNQTHLN